MPQATPDADVRASESGGYSGAFPAPVWVGSAVELAAGNNALRPGDGTNGTTDEDTVYVGANTSSSTATITLGSVSATDGRVIIVNDEGGNAATNNITVDTEGGETIDGSASTSISSNYGTLRVISDGSDWFTW